MTSWLPSSLGGLMKRSRSEVAVSSSNRPPAAALLAQHMSLDCESPPEIEGESECLRAEDILRLGEHLPPRLVGSTWRPVFATSSHGFSLGSLYRKSMAQSGPSLLVIEDTQGGVFGALTSCPLRESDHFYGTGESFLFTCRPHWRLYSWAGDNQLFVRGTPHDLVVGAGEGRFGIWLDSSLYQGRTQACQTYRNEPLTSQGDFTIKSVECWTFD